MDIPKGYYIETNGYVRNSKTRKYLHRELLNAQKGEIVDHINGDRTDNRIENLRITDYYGNSRNKRRGSNNTSGYCGVKKRSHRNLYMAYIRVHDKVLYLGDFKTVEEAAAVRKEAEIKYGFVTRN